MINVANKLRDMNVERLRRGAVRKLTRKRRLPRPPRLLFPEGSERLYIRQLEAVIARIHAVVTRDVIPRLGGIVRQAEELRPTVREDAAPFEESKHPRAEDGKFGSGGGGASSESSQAGASAKPRDVKPADVISKASFSHTQGVVLKDYKENSYTLINSFLRDPATAKVKASTEIRPADDAEKKRAAADVKHIDMAFEKSSLKEDTVVHRGLVSASLSANPEKMVGHSIPEEGYLSTTTDQNRVYGNHEQNHIVLHIKAKAGTKAIDMDRFEEGSTAGEREILFPRGGSIKVTGFERKGNAVHYTAELVYPQTKTDAADDVIKQLMDMLRGRVFSLMGKDALEADLRRVAERIAAANGGQINNAFKETLGVDLFQTEPWLEAEMKLFVESNLGLIQGAGRKYWDDVTATLYDGARQGLSTDAIADNLTDRFGIASRRAKFIARDQVAKFNGQLTELRQTQAGVTRYRWRTSRDERVRKTHREMEGKVCDWDSPPLVGGAPAHPGQQINCRCFAEPVLEDLIP